MMRICTLLICIFFQGVPALAPAQEMASGQELDFWLGEWRVVWYGPDSSRQEGTNHIRKALDGVGVEEQFVAPGMNFKGKSISVFNSKTGQWHQAWADNQGGFLTFVGNLSEEIKIFQTLPDKQGAIRRMVFHNIKPNSFIWDWEQSTDGGQHWELKWQILYYRK